MTPSSNHIADLQNAVKSPYFTNFISGYSTNANDPNYLVKLISSLINFLLGFLGIALVILILYAGFLWMTAGGDEKKITLAKDMIKNAIIGIIIILSAWSIAFFVINALLNVTTGNNP